MPGDDRYAADRQSFAFEAVSVSTHTTNQAPDAGPVPTHRAGSPRAALSNRPFRWVFLGSFASNIGTWMQNVTLGLLAARLTGAATYVGIVAFAQLGPTLFLSPLGGVLADRVNRKRVMVTASITQTALSLALALVASNPNPSRTVIVAIVAGIGIAGAFYGPAANATLPALVRREDLPGAVSLNSFAMNGSRVLGPMLAGLLGSTRPSLIFALNAATYLFVIAAITSVDFDGAPAAHEGAGRRPGFVDGVRAARADRVVARILVTVSVYSLCSLLFIYQMPTLARENLHLSDGRYPVLFASFGLGAAIGALCVGTVFSGLPRALLARAGLAAFAVFLAVFSLLRSPTWAFPVVFATGFTYFVVITAMSTILQQRVADSARGRIMGLWMMGWAGLVPVGSLAAGPIIDATGVTPVILGGAAVAALLVFYADLREPAPAELSPPPTTRRRRTRGGRPGSP